MKPRTAFLALALLAGTASAQRARSAPPRMRVLVPADFHPVPGSPWDRLDLVAERHPALVWAIGNPASGPGASPDPTQVATLAAEADPWFQWYGVDGILIDEMDNVPGTHESYYAQVIRTPTLAHPTATDDMLPNPWDTLPSWFEAMVDTLDANY